MTPKETDALVHMIHLANNEVMKRRGLPVWTIYDHPKDYPEHIVARMHELHAEGTRPTDKVVALDLETLRKTFKYAGLICVPRQARDDKVIVEVWL